MIYIPYKVPSAAFKTEISKGTGVCVVPIMWGAEKLSGSNWYFAWDSTTDTQASAHIFPVNKAASLQGDVKAK